MIGREPDTRSIGVETEPEFRPDIRSAKTNELLKTSLMAETEVEVLFDSHNKEKPKFNSEYFKPPRELNKKDLKKDFCSNVQEG